MLDRVFLTQIFIADDNNTVVVVIKFTSEGFFCKINNSDYLSVMMLYLFFERW